MRNIRKIGIIGGVGPQATYYIYKKIIALSQKKYGAKNNEDYPEIIIHSLPIPDFISNEEKITKSLEMLKSSVKLLTKNKASVLAIASNTIHILFEELRKVTNVKFISIIKLVAEKCSRKNCNKVALLGSPILIKSGIYEKELIKYGIKTLLPNEKEMIVLDYIIRGVIAGKINRKITEKYLRLINRLYNKGADAFILGCTELPLAINYEILGELKNKILNSSEILAEGLVDYYYS